MKTIHAVSCLLVAASTLSAQTSQSFVIPQAFATQNAASTNSFPWTYTGYVRMMQVIDASEFGSARVLDGMSLRPRSWGTAQQKPFTLDFSIRLSLSAKAVGQLDGTYANNIKGQQTEVYRGPVYFHTPSGNTPAEFSVTIPFQKRFIYTGTDPLLIDIVPISPCAGGGDSRGCDYDRTSTKMSTVLGKGSCGNVTSGGSASAGGYVIKFWGPSLPTFGFGCKGSSGKAPELYGMGAAQLGNTSFGIGLTSAKTNSAAALFMGFTNQTFGGSIPLPLDLQVLGAPGCWLWTDIVLVGSTATNAQGDGSVPFPLPADNRFSGASLFFQWAVLDLQANASGLAFSEGGVTYLY